MKTYPLLFITLLGIVTLLFLGLLSSIFYPLFWAVVFSIIFAPLHARLFHLLKRKTASAAATLAIVLLFVFIPLGFLGTLVTQEALAVYSTLQGTDTTEGFAVLEAATTWIASLEAYGIETDALRSRIETMGTTAGAVVASQFVSLGQATVGFLISFLIMVYVLFYLLRDGASIGTALKHAFPLDDNDEQFLFNRFAEMTRAMFKSTLTVSVAQGLVGGILFALADISSPLLWAVAMTVLAMIPGVGPIIVWLPAGLLLVLSGAYIPGAIVLTGGVTILSYIDNVLRATLVGNDTHMPDVLIFISVISGLFVFGVTGLVIGPALAALTVAFWELYAKR